MAEAEFRLKVQVQTRPLNETETAAISELTRLGVDERKARGFVGFLRYANSLYGEGKITANPWGVWLSAKDDDQKRVIIDAWSKTAEKVGASLNSEVYIGASRQIGERFAIVSAVLPDNNGYEVAMRNANARGYATPVAVIDYDYGRIKREARMAADIGMGLIWFSPISIYDSTKLVVEGAKERQPLLVAAGLSIGGLELASIGPLDIATKPMEFAIKRLAKEWEKEAAEGFAKRTLKLVTETAERKWLNRAAIKTVDIAADLSRKVESGATKLEFNLDKHVLRTTRVDKAGKTLDWPEYSFWEQRFRARAAAGKESLPSTVSIHEMAATPEGKQKLGRWYLEEIETHVNNGRLESTVYFHEPIEGIKRAQVCVRRTEAVAGREFEFKAMLEYRPELDRWAVNTAYAEPLPLTRGKRFKTNFELLQQKTKDYIEKPFDLME
ncbi:Uncharacterised protein [uncultured archaeon]|nr:Uncharacterised protein [uncultured archaeon]